MNPDPHAAFRLKAEATPVSYSAARRSASPRADHEAIAEDARSADDIRLPAAGPHRAEMEQGQRAAGEPHGEQQQAGAVAASRVLDRAEHRRQEEATQAARGADDPGHQSHPIGEALRHQLEHRAVAHTQAAERDEQDRDHCRQRRKRRGDRQRRGHDHQQPQQQPVAADPIRQPAADRAQQASGDDDQRREVAGAHLRDVILLVEERGQEAGEADEAAEGQRIESAEPQRVRLLQHAGVVPPRLPRALLRAVLCEQRERDRHEQHRQRASGRTSPPSRSVRRAAARRAWRAAIPNCRHRRCPSPGPGAPADTSGWPAAAPPRSSRRRRRAAGRWRRSARASCANFQPSTSGTSVNASPISPARRPPMRSPRMPSSGRKNDPPSSGTATSSPRWVAVRASSSRRNGASGPSRTHTMKLMSKYISAATSVGRWPLFRKLRLVVIRCRGSGLRGCALGGQAGSWPERGARGWAWRAGCTMPRLASDRCAAARRTAPRLP